jgi:hypothetical protein
LKDFIILLKKYFGKEYINIGYKKLDFEEVGIKVINFYNKKNFD